MKKTYTKSLLLVVIGLAMIALVIIILRLRNLYYENRDFKSIETIMSATLDEAKKTYPGARLDRKCYTLSRKFEKEPIYCSVSLIIDADITDSEEVKQKISELSKLLRGDERVSERQCSWQSITQDDQETGRTYDLMYRCGNISSTYRYPEDVD